MSRKNEIPETECVSCGAPQGEYVTRAVGNHLRWSMDTSLAVKEGATWLPPVKVFIFQRSGLCRSCHGAAGRAA